MSAPAEAQQQAQQLEAESAETSSIGSGESSKLDSIYASDDNASITTSLRSFVKDYKTEHGRRYHAFERDKWMVPNDEAQQNQMDLFHAVYSRVQAYHKGDTLNNPNADRLFLSPIGENPQRVLDVGTGTGIWAICFADEHPSAEVIGTDISPIQPEWVPPNLQFEVDDCEQEWTYSKDSFDFIYIRGLHGAVSNWPKLLKQAFDALKPGGYLEVTDEAAEVFCDDGTMKPEDPTADWLTQSRGILDMIGRTGTPYKEMEKWMDEVGFDSTTLEHKSIKIPIGIWPKDKVLKQVGGMMLVGLLSGLEGWVMNGWIHVLKKSEEETKAYISTVQKHMKNRKVHMYMPLHVIYAQKPKTA